MPLEIKEIDLEAECERLHEEMKETAQEQIEWANSNAAAEYAQQLQVRGSKLNNYRNVLEKAIGGDLSDLPAFDTVTVAGLSPGDRNRAQDFAEENDGVKNEDCLVAVGTQDAPWLEHDPDSVTSEAFRETVLRIVDDVPIPVVEWAEERIGELSHLSGEMGNEYTRLLVETAEASMTETQTNG